ncbi:MAG: zf-TFIIB domain-containing protein [Pseudomonadota bacterium]
MKCPVDGETLKITERSGVEIDYCPVCRGVWLDRGELDKIIERVDGPIREAEPAGAHHHDDWHNEGGWGDRRDYDDRSRKYRRPKRRESLLGELFDLFD